MRKLRKLDLCDLSEKMEVVSVEEQTSIVGAYYYDCFWRCVCYLATGYTDEASAEIYAQNYLADTMFSGGTSDKGGALAHLYLTKYGAEMDYQDARRYVRENGVTDGKIVCINPDNIADYRNNGYESVLGGGHYVVITGDYGDYIQVFDPQNNRSFSIMRSEMTFENEYYPVASSYSY